MIHPRELLRTDSDGTQGYFSAPADAVHQDIDCGIKNLPCLNRVFGLEKYARLVWFLAVLSLVGIFQGIILAYFRETAHIWDKFYHIPSDSVDWMIYLNEFIMGVVALAIAYWGNRIHRASWLGSLTMFLAISCALLIVPEIYQTELDHTKRTLLCHNSSVNPSASAQESSVHHIGVVTLALFQFCYACASVSYVAHGITYIDDNITSLASATWIGVALAMRELGQQIGIYSSWFINIFQTKHVFLSSAWIIVTITMFILGLLISMFPKDLPSTVINRLSASLLDLASGHSSPHDKPKVNGFFASLWRLWKSKVLIINILATSIMQSAIVNFKIFQNYFNESMFHIPSSIHSPEYRDPLRLVLSLMKQPLVVTAMILSGIFIAKGKPKTRTLVMWIIVLYILTILLLDSNFLLKCTTPDFDSYYQNKPACSTKCSCSLDDPFLPICLNGTSYFSPCFAGCTTKLSGFFTQFKDCTCDRNEVATEGICEGNCYMLFGFSQVNSVISDVLLASTYIINVVVVLRSVQKEDKALALGLESCLYGLIPYIPVKSLYSLIADRLCQYKRQDDGKCMLYQTNFNKYLLGGTTSLMVVAVLLSIILFFLVRNHKFYVKNQSDTNLKDLNTDQPHEEHLFKQLDAEEDTLGKLQSWNNANLSKHSSHSKVSEPSMTNSLLDLEDIGDDHDSLDFSIQGGKDLATNGSLQLVPKALETDF